MSGVGGVSGSGGQFRTTPKKAGFGQAAGGIFKDLLVGGASFATGSFGGVLAENRFWTTESNVMKAKHDMNKAIINNFRG